MSGASLYVLPTSVSAPRPLVVVSAPSPAVSEGSEA